MGKKKNKKKSFDDYDALLDDSDAAADPVPAEPDDGAAATQGGIVRAVASASGIYGTIHLSPKSRRLESRRRGGRSGRGLTF